MKTTLLKNCLGSILAGSLFMLSSLTTSLGQALFVGDSQNDTIEAVDAGSGSYLGPLVHSSIDTELYKITGPRGIVFWKGLCLVANQNANLAISGEVLAFDANTGQFVGGVARYWQAAAPFAPRGMVVIGNILYVADIGDFVSHPGQILMYNLANGGAFLGKADTRRFDKVFGPRGLVLGPDGLLYVSTSGNLAINDRAPGYILRFSIQPATGIPVYRDTFVASDASNGYASGLHRPEGIAFGPDGLLYATTFLTGSDMDGVIAFNKAGKKVFSMDLWTGAGPRVYAQALLFGPGGDLFLPLSNATGVRRYLAGAGYGSYVDIPGTGNALSEGWYLSFKETNPATLQFEP